MLKIFSCVHLKTLSRYINFPIISSALLSHVPDIKADERGTCTLPETVAPVPQEIDPSKENSILFTYSVRWEVRWPPPPSRRSLPVSFGFINSCSLLHCRRAKWNGRLAGTRTSPWVTCRSTGSPSSTPWSWCSSCQVWLIFILMWLFTSTASK